MSKNNEIGNDRESFKYLDENAFGNLRILEIKHIAINYDRKYLSWLLTS